MSGRNRGILLAGYFLLPAFLLGQTAQTKKLTAREMFYAAPAPAATPKPATPPKPAAKAAPPKTIASNPKPSNTKAPNASPASVAVPAREESQKNPDYVAVAYTPGSAPSQKPLGLKYSILKRVGEQMVEVSPDTVFRAGDRIQVAVETNDSGYLYIILQGSSGTWKPMFPSAEIEDGNNHVVAGRRYLMPPKSRFIFDEQAGVEKLFLVLSRQPIEDLDLIIYDLRGGQRPVSEPAAPRKEHLLIAANMSPIDDAMVSKLRNVYTRDLVIEEVNEETPGPQKEHAVYVVNPTGSTDSRVVADIRLNHQ